MKRTPKAKPTAKAISVGSAEAAANNNASLAEALQVLDSIRKDLEDVLVELLKKKPPVDDPSWIEWAKQADMIDLAVLRATSAHLRGIAQIFEADLTAIKAKTAGLAAQVKALNNAADVINAVAGAIEFVGKVIAIGR